MFKLCKCKYIGREIYYSSCKDITTNFLHNIVNCKIVKVSFSLWLYVKLFGLFEEEE